MGEEENAEKESTEKSAEESDGRKSLPVLSNILISIDETDAQGNIVKSRIVEAQETRELPSSEGSPLILT